jgi:hypothetical protein
LFALRTLLPLWCGYVTNKLIFDKVAKPYTAH